jgi:hypothetical protein
MIDFAAFSDPARNWQFSRRWFEIEMRPVSRRRPRRERHIRAMRAFDCPLGRTDRRAR